MELLRPEHSRTSLEDGKLLRGMQLNIKDRRFSLDQTIELF